MLRSLAEGIRERVGLLVGKASVDQATGNRVRIEHKVMLPRGSQPTVVGRRWAVRDGPISPTISNSLSLKLFVDGACGPVEPVSRCGK